MNNRNQSSNFKQSSSKMTKTIQVPPEMVGMIIGRGGETVKKIAKDAGSGCRLYHIKEKPGTFEMCAFSKKALLFAEVKVKELINNTKHNKRPTSKSKPIRKPISSNNNTFSMLEESPECSEKIPNTSLKNSRRMDLTIIHRDNIKQRKRDHWNRKNGFTQQSPSVTHKSKSFDVVSQHFPTLGQDTISDTVSKPTASVWGKSLDTIKTAPTEQPKKVEVVIEKPEPEFKMNFYPRAKFMEDSNNDNKDDWGDDISDWGDEYEEEDNNNWDQEEDNWDQHHTEVIWA
jgi:hypothetical protein